MAADLKSETLIARYLLGELPEEQQIEIEDRAFSDREFLASVTAVENDLIDEYVRGEMSETDRRRFESRFLVSESRRKRVEFARTLVHLLPEMRVTERETRKVSATRSSWRDALAALIQGLNPAGRIALATATLLVLLAACQRGHSTLAEEEFIALLGALTAMKFDGYCFAEIPESADPVRVQQIEKEGQIKVQEAEISRNEKQLIANVLKAAEIERLARAAVRYLRSGGIVKSHLRQLRTEAGRAPAASAT